MARANSKTARTVAAEVLRQFDPAQGYAGVILNRLAGQTKEIQRATDLVFGTIRNLQAIDTVITTFSGRHIERIASRLLSPLRIAVYELAYNPATPPYSILNEAVNTAKSVGGRKQTGFVNAVLREITRQIADRQAPLASSDPMRTLIQTPETGCVFNTEILPDPEDSPAAYLSACFSLPVWLVGDWLDLFGLDQTRQICLASNRRPSLYVRANPLKTTGADLLETFRQADTQAELLDRETPRPGPAPEMLKISGPQSVTRLPGFSQGLFTVQDSAASNAVAMLNPQPGWSILDLCAAPGTKTTQLAEATGDSAHITATDIDPDRLAKIYENLTRLGLKSVTVVPYNNLAQATPGSFDAVLLDVPCSNTGVLARRIEVRFRVKPGAMKKLGEVQRGLLERAAALVKPGGRICYSTCSIQSAEDGDLIRGFLTAHPQFELAAEELILPSAGPHDHDGAYTAVIGRL